MKGTTSVMAVDFSNHLVSIYQIICIWMILTYTSFTTDKKEKRKLKGSKPPWLVIIHSFDFSPLLVLFISICVPF